MPCPRVTAAIGRSGATIGTREKSNGLPMSAIGVDGQVRVARVREQREDAAEAPADQPDRPPAGVGGRGADRLGDHLVEEVLEPERAVGELDLPVVDDVGLLPRQQQVLGERAAPPQVEAERGRGQRRHEQHGAGRDGFRAARPARRAGSGRGCAGARGRSAPRASAAGPPGRRGPPRRRSSRRRPRHAPGRGCRASGACGGGVRPDRGRGLGGRSRGADQHRAQRRADKREQAGEQQQVIEPADERLLAEPCQLRVAASAARRRRR